MGNHRRKVADDELRGGKGNNTVGASNRDEQRKTGEKEDRAGERRQRDEEEEAQNRRRTTQEYQETNTEKEQATQESERREEAEDRVSFRQATSRLHPRLAATSANNYTGLSCFTQSILCPFVSLITYSLFFGALLGKRGQVEEDIKENFSDWTSTLTIRAIPAMVIGFITGSYAVLAPSLWLAITIGVAFIFFASKAFIVPVRIILKY
ncbi:hypothetical protein NC652_033797 [Populus alba x Populus x berolinensis]|nr:hypothetical protein NC652_033797 [Populus alba x Populus x berolinensis]